MSDKNKDVKFVRIKGKVVPIKQGKPKKGGNLEKANKLQAKAKKQAMYAGASLIFGGPFALGLTPYFGYQSYKTSKQADAAMQKYMKNKKG